MANKKKDLDKKLTKEERKLKKEAKRRAKEKKLSDMDTNVKRYLARLTVQQMEMVTKFSTECLEKGGKEKRYINELTNEKEKELIRELIDVMEGKIQVKAIGGKDLARLWKRKHFSFINKAPDKQIGRRESVASGFSNSNNQPDNQPHEPDYDEPSQPVDIDEKLFDELDKHSDEVNKYLDGI